MLKQKSIKAFVYGVLGLFAVGLPLSSAWAHGGAAGTDTDQCKIQVGTEWVHFTAYQPYTSGQQEFCESLPGLGQTNLVFDYVGHALRKLTVEFEITKEPEGTRVYYQAPTQHKSGTVNAVVNFTDAGNYLAHVALVPENGEKIDKHIAFAVGVGESNLTQGNILLFFVIGGGLLYAVYLSSASFKEKVDSLLKKAKSV